MGNDTHALVMENKDRSKIKGTFRHNKSRGRSKSRGKLKCYHFGKIGHMKRNYKILKQGGDKSHKQEDANVVTLLCNQEDCCHVAEQDVEWEVNTA